MRILKYIAFALGGVAALLVAGGLFIYATFDANKLKSEVTQIVKEKKQRTLSIDGDFALSFWPSIGLQLGRTRLSEHASDAEFAALDSARVSLAILPLFSKQVVIDQLELAGVSATLVRGKDGKLNIDDLLSKDDQPENQTLRFDVSSIKLKDSRLAYRDEQAGRSATLSALNLTTGKIANVAHGRMQLDGKLAVDKPVVATDLALVGDYDIDLDKKRFSLGAADIRVKGDASVLNKLDLSLTVGKLGLDPAAAQVDAEKLKLTVKGMLEAEALDIRLETPKLLASAEKASSDAINIVARFTGPQRAVDARLDLAGVQGSAKAMQVARLLLAFDGKSGDFSAKGGIDSPLTANLQTLVFEMPGFALEIDAKAGTNAIKGRLASPLKANLQAMTFDLAKLSGELTVASPQMPMKSVRMPLDGEAHADLTKQTAGGQLATKFDESAMRGKFSIAKFSPLAVGFELDIDRINVDKYFPPVAPDAKKVAADKPIDLSALKGLNANGAVRIGALQAAGVKASNLKLQIKAANGKLDVAPHSANLYDGALAGSFSADANGNRMVAKETLTNVNIDPLLRDVTGNGMIEGRGNLSLDLATGGASVAAMKRALGGNARLALRDGAIKGINIGKALREYKAVSGIQQGAARKAVSTEKTDFTEISASFRIANGVAHNDDLQAKSLLLRLGGSGDINIADNSIHYVVKAAVVNTSTGQEGKELANLKGVTVPVHLSGQFDALSYRVDVAAIATDLAKTRVNEATQQLQQRATDKVQSQVQGKLKGVLGR